VTKERCWSVWVWVCSAEVEFEEESEGEEETEGEVVEDVSDVRVDFWINLLIFDLRYDFELKAFSISAWIWAFGVYLAGRLLSLR